jgi:hypothetical protein
MQALKKAASFVFNDVSLQVQVFQACGSAMSSRLVVNLISLLVCFERPEAAAFIPIELFSIDRDSLDWPRPYIFAPLPI